MQKGTIGVTTDNIFPIIKKFLYSDHEIFLRELVSNAVDATQKLKALAAAGEFTGELGDVTVKVKLDKEAKTITISDNGIGMTAEEIEKYINQIAFSSAGDFLEKYKDKIDAIIGHFGLGFYSSFMVAEQVEIFTRSYKTDAKAVRWACKGDPEYTIEEIEKETRGTEIVLHIEKDSEEFLERERLQNLLTKYCKFLPIEISFGKKQEWKDGKYVDTEEDNLINNTKPAWTKKPADLKDEDYSKFYKELFPMGDEPLFNIHLNVDYPFNLTGILYFPKIKNNLDISRNKIQLYCNQVYVTDSVEGIVPEFLTLLHGVLDSPDIPLNVSRSYLQSDSNVKKISSHINKKVADRLNEIFKKDREEFEKKWDDLKLFITYGMLSDEKFFERASKFALFKNIDNKYFTFEEYNNLVKESQKDKDNKAVYLYTTDKEKQFSFVEKAKAKGYDVLLFEGQLDTHFINTLESKLPDVRFARVDADVIEKLIDSENKHESKLSLKEIDTLTPVIQSQLPVGDYYHVVFENLSETESPMLITQQEFMRRMKEMSQMNGGGMNFYGQLPDSYNLVVNSNNKLILQLLEDVNKSVGENLVTFETQISIIKSEIDSLKKLKEGKKEEEVPQEEKDLLEEKENKLDEVKNEKDEMLKKYGTDNKLVKQMIDLALLANNLLKGEALSKFVNRSFELIEK